MYKPAKLAVFLVLILPLMLAAKRAEAMTQKAMPGLPAIAEGKIYEDDWQHQETASDKFTKILQQKFPVGSDEQKMIQILTAQGFKYPRPPQPGCIKLEDALRMPVGKAYTPCPTYDAKHLLGYGWKPYLSPRASACVLNLAVSWEAKDGKLTHVRGQFSGLCP